MPADQLLAVERTRDLPTRSEIRLALRMAPDRTVLFGSFLGIADHDALIVGTAAGTHTVDGRIWTFGETTLLVVAHPADEIESISSPAATASAPPSTWRVPFVSDDIGELLRTGVAALPGAVRADLLAFLIDACAAGRTVLPSVLAANLHIAREALRPRLSVSTVDRESARALTIEICAELDQQSFYVRGWIGHRSSALRSVVAVSPEGTRTELLPTLYRYPRHDVAQFYGEEQDRFGYGFAAHFEIAVPSGHQQGWLIEVVPAEDPTVEARTSDLIRGMDAVRNLLVSDLALERLPHEDFRNGHVAPAVGRLLTRAQTRVEARRVEQYGDAPDAPEVSVVVPLYKRVDFVEHQLCQFVHDPELAGADLIYVLDSPELEDGFIAEAHRLFRLYRVPFRIVVSSHNGGFSVANNLGAAHARGRLLLLMNSDVMPDRPGWLGALKQFYDAQPAVGAIGPKLVYEDDSIQHAGMYFERPVGGALWSNEHYFKGLHRTFAPACVSRRVPAVTAACMMISTDLYRQFGGLRGTYVQGDFEDSDLCMRLTAAGHEHWYVADVEMYHLEGQSYPSAQRVSNGQFNQWLHTRDWGEDIEVLMAEGDFR